MHYAYLIDTMFVLPFILVQLFILLYFQSLFFVANYHYFIFIITCIIQENSYKKSIENRKKNVTQISSFIKYEKHRIKLVKLTYEMKLKAYRRIDTLLVVPVNFFLHIFYHFLLFVPITIRYIILLNVYLTNQSTILQKINK